MRTLTVNGEAYEARPLAEGEACAGMLLACRHNRSAFRVVCEDEGSLILRNMRHPNILDAVPQDVICELFVRIEPVARR